MMTHASQNHASKTDVIVDGRNWQGNELKISMVIIASSLVNHKSTIFAAHQSNSLSSIEISSQTPQRLAHD
jgi:hypothetical protein